MGKLYAQCDGSSQAAEGACQRAARNRSLPDLNERHGERGEVREVQYNVVGVRFKRAGKVYYFDPVDLPIEKDSHVIVETARGVEYGKVVIGQMTVKENDV